MKLIPMSRADAVAMFKYLIKTYGTNFNILVPIGPRLMMSKCSAVLTREEKEAMIKEYEDERGPINDPTAPRE